MGTKRRIRGALVALVALAALAATAAHAQSTTEVLPAIDVWASRTDAGIVGASTSVITAEDIARSPGTTLQDLLSQEAGVQTQQHVERSERRRHGRRPARLRRDSFLEHARPAQWTPADRHR
jgi:outer membrane receptor for ferrienterochelin and colicin